MAMERRAGDSDKHHSENRHDLEEAPLIPDREYSRRSLDGAKRIDDGMRVTHTTLSHTALAVSELHTVTGPRRSCRLDVTYHKVKAWVKDECSRSVGSPVTGARRRPGAAREPRCLTDDDER